MVCTFFGHRDCWDLDTAALRKAMEDLIRKGVDMFYVGNQGAFDSAVHTCLTVLARQYPHIRYGVVLAYLPAEKQAAEAFSDTIYPEGMEQVPRKFAIERRNCWMLEQADCCICYINYTWGGAYKFARQAKRRGMVVTNLGKAAL